MIYSIIFYGKELTCQEVMDLLSVLIGTPRSLACNKVAILDTTWYVYIYI